MREKERQASARVLQMRDATGAARTAVRRTMPLNAERMAYRSRDAMAEQQGERRLCNDATGAQLGAAGRWQQNPELPARSWKLNSLERNFPIAAARLLRLLSFY
jgi:hypothetical protein